MTDYSLYPDEAYQLDWIRVYLEEWNRIHDPDTPVTEQDIRKMYRQVNISTLVRKTFYLHIFMPPQKEIRGHSVFVLSVCVSVCGKKKLTLTITFEP